MWRKGRKNKTEEEMNTGVKKNQLGRKIWKER